MFWNKNNVFEFSKVFSTSLPTKMDINGNNRRIYFNNKINMSLGQRRRLADSFKYSWAVLEKSVVYDDTIQLPETLLLDYVRRHDVYELTFMDYPLKVLRPVNGTPDHMAGYTPLSDMYVISSKSVTPDEIMYAAQRKGSVKSDRKIHTDDGSVTIDNHQIVLDRVKEKKPDYIKRKGHLDNDDGTVTQITLYFAKKSSSSSGPIVREILAKDDYTFFIE